MRTYFLFILTGLMFCSQNIISQDSLEYAYVTESSGFDIGINVTSVISSFSGNGDELEASDLPIVFRFTRPNSAVRIGLGVKGSNSSFFDNVTFAERQSTQQSYFAKAGIEIHSQLDYRWQFYYGIDAVGSMIKGDVQISGNFSSSNIEQKIIGFGASPFVGFRLFIGNRFYLSTESNFTYLYKLFDTTERFTDINGNPDMRTTDSQASEFSISAPVQLYINYRLK